MSDLAFGEYVGVIKETRVVLTPQEQEIAEMDVQVDGHDEPVTVMFRLYGNAESISVQAISRLGFKGTLQQIHENTSPLTGMRVTLVAKQGKPTQSGGHFTNYSLLPLRKVAATKVRDLNFGQAAAGGGSW